MKKAVFDRRSALVGLVVSAATVGGAAVAAAGVKVVRTLETDSVERVRKIVHVTVGDPTWEPTKEEMEKVADLFNAAMLDEKGGVVVTGKSVTAHVLDV